MLFALILGKHPMFWLAVLCAGGLASVHLYAGRLKFLGVTPRSRWLSAAGGISVAYVFLHLLPELAEGQALLKEATNGTLGFLEHHAYLLALAGLVVFYGIERAAKHSGKSCSRQGSEEIPSAKIFGLHIVSFSLYNLLVGYLLANSTETLRGLLYFFLAMALHFLVNDYGLKQHYRHMYATAGRWTLATAVLLGFGIGMLYEIPELALSLLTAFLAGGIILNVMKEELPEERESRFGAFFAGCLFYASLLLAL